MSDEVLYVKKQNILHYGSLEEEADKIRQDHMDIVDEDSDPGSPGTQAADEYMDLEEDNASKERQILLQEFERRKKARHINVSTDDNEVKATLRQLREPICLFGEGPADRRERLRQLFVNLGDDSLVQHKKVQKLERPLEKDKELQATTWYHQGPDSLQKARVFLAKYSLPRAKERVELAQEQLKIPDSQKNAKRQEIYKKLRTLTISLTQIGDTRPMSYCRFSPDSSMLVTGSHSGLCKIWTIPDFNLARTLDGHGGNRIGAIVFRPQATLPGSSPQELSLASCAADGSVKLWNLESDQPIQDLPGHVPHQVSRVAFHPSGRLLGTCVHDNSWRLWDLGSMQELIHQEGHSKPVYDISFQCDGSLAATGGLDSFGRVWDLRTGRCIMFMEGHLKPLRSICFSPNGYQIATGSQDNCLKIWNLRQQKCEYTIPAHTSLVSHVSFEKNSGQYLITTSYDNTLKVWSHPGWTPIHTLSGHDGKVTCGDLAGQGDLIATTSFDRTIKLWAPE
ncbi:PRPF4 [Cordylochernes scorpioides]|uniref:PRPF4 n=1 Tax=Cordylochernes scorpioides TaxID=51811 RepID=A0ABY6LD25_9ARAC|nr:PRPF4 [Cordylochernes scorpioides]